MSRSRDVALSFAGEDRWYVDPVAAALEAAGVDLFYDASETTELWGEDLAVRLDAVYRQQARFVVPFVSVHYAQKVWPQHEWRSALARAVTQREPFILPVRLDDTDLPGLRPTVLYLDGRRFGPKEVAGHVLAKLQRGESATGGAARELGRLPSIAPQNFNPYAEAEGFLRHLEQQFRSKIGDLRRSGIVLDVARGERLRVRALMNGQDISGMEIWIGGMLSQRGLSFHYGIGRFLHDNSFTATAEIEWDSERRAPVADMLDFSLMADQDRHPLTKEELFEYLWERLCTDVEQKALRR